MLMEVRAGFLDPQGRKVWRVLTYAIPTFALLFAIFGPIHGHPATAMGFGSVGLLHLLGVLDLRQRTKRQVELTCGPGYVDVSKAGTRNQRILARDVKGATTARTGKGLLLTLQHHKRNAPITLELESDADAAKVRHALGIGHGGFGEVAWRTAADSNRRTGFVGNLLGAATGIGIALALLFGDRGGEAIAILLGMAGFFATILGIAGALSPKPEPTIVMTAAGLRLRTPRGWFALPYEAMREVDDSPERFIFTVPEPYHSVVVDKSKGLLGGLSPAERDTALAQVRAAAQRARGMGPEKVDVSGRVDVLRRQGESPRDWLVRLDMAGQTLDAGAGYRGNTLDAEDLWTILEDPEAEPELRAAAARVLRHLRAPETRVRIDTALAAVRDEPTNRRLRIAVNDDLEGATQALAYLEAEERQIRAAQQAQIPYHQAYPAPPVRG